MDSMASPIACASDYLKSIAIFAAVLLCLYVESGCSAKVERSEPGASSLRPGLSPPQVSSFAELCAWTRQQFVNERRPYRALDVRSVFRLNGREVDDAPCGGNCMELLHTGSVARVTMNVQQPGPRGFLNPSQSPSSLDARLPSGGPWQFSVVATDACSTTNQQSPSAGIHGEGSAEGAVCVAFERPAAAPPVTVEQGVSWMQFASFRAQISYSIAFTDRSVLFRYVSAEREMPARTTLVPSALEQCPGGLEGAAHDRLIQYFAE